MPLESKDFKVNSVKWSANGKSIVIADKNRFIVAYPKFEIMESGDNENYF